MTSSTPWEEEAVEACNAERLSRSKICAKIDGLFLLGLGVLLAFGCSSGANDSAQHLPPNGSRPLCDSNRPGSVSGEDSDQATPTPIRSLNLLFATDADLPRKEVQGLDVVLTAPQLTLEGWIFLTETLRPSSLTVTDWLSKPPGAMLEIGQCDSITQLSFVVCYFGVSEFSVLARSPSIVRVALDDCLGVEDEHIYTLASMPQLEEISLKKASITMRGVTALLRLQNLKRLDLSGCRLLGVHRQEIQELFSSVEVIQ